ncbi:MAG: 5-formyltetrahydrofolate cyclo-ligase [Ruminiclostridium sp.]|nr:5-formyltetrahydrofolate cyclo-ligase [Ruminiclostridium sp.]
MSEQKKDLRRELVAFRRNMEENVRKNLDEKIYNNVMGLGCVRNADKFLVYASSSVEVDTRRFIDGMLSRGKTVAVPKCVGKDMRFLKTDSLEALVKSSYGVDEPADGEEIVSDSSTVCIVPGLRFDRNGYRLGWGGGFYDRFLSGFTGISVGICYHECCGAVPTDEFDIPVSIVITENGIYNK